ncbi:MAG: hypothetical protein KDA93_14515 [Planctomycetaceae bacterium]|nr:hypothetical protein [Planctomycetaceae bacterium]
MKGNIEVLGNLRKYPKLCPDNGNLLYSFDIKNAAVILTGMIGTVIVRRTRGVQGRCPDDCPPTAALSQSGQWNNEETTFLIVGGNTQ